MKGPPFLYGFRYLREYRTSFFCMFLAIELIFCKAHDPVTPFRYFDPQIHDGNGNPALLHIVKTAGTSVMRELTQSGGFDITSRELCIGQLKDIYGPKSFTITFLRSPREHVLSQFMQSKYSRMYSPAFPANSSDAEGFKTWIEYFYDSWNKRSDDKIIIARNAFNAYHPYNLQSRALSDICDKQHNYPQNEPQSDNHMRSAITNFDELAFSGVTELYSLSMCLLWHYLGDAYRDIRDIACFPNNVHGRISHKSTIRIDDNNGSSFSSSSNDIHVYETHNLPAHSVHAITDQRLWAKVDELTAFDLKLWKRAVTRLFANVKQFESEVNQSIAHLYHKFIIIDSTT